MCIQKHLNAISEDGSQNWAGFSGTGGFYEIGRQVRNRFHNTLVAHLFV